jgi:hypothetical protein
MIFNILKGYNNSDSGGQDNHGHTIIGAYTNDTAGIKKMYNDKLKFEIDEEIKEISSVFTGEFGVQISMDQLDADSPEEAISIEKKKFFDPKCINEKIDACLDYNVLLGYKKSRDAQHDTILGVFSNDYEGMRLLKKKFDNTLTNGGTCTGIYQVNAKNIKDAENMSNEEINKEKSLKEDTLNFKEFLKSLNEDADIDRSKMAIDDNHSIRLGARGSHQYDVDMSEFDFDPETDTYTSKKKNKYGAVTSFSEDKK